MFNFICYDYTYTEEHLSFFTCCFSQNSKGCFQDLLTLSTLQQWSLNLDQPDEHPEIVCIQQRSLTHRGPEFWFDLIILYHVPPCLDGLLQTTCLLLAHGFSSHLGFHINTHHPLLPVLSPGRIFRDKRINVNPLKIHI